MERKLKKLIENSIIIPNKEIGEPNLADEDVTELSLEEFIKVKAESYFHADKNRFYKQSENQWFRHKLTEKKDNSLQDQINKLWKSCEKFGIETDNEIKELKSELSKLSKNQEILNRTISNYVGKKYDK